MTADNATPSKYDLAIVEQVILEEAIGLHPHHLIASELCLRIVNDSDDSREVETTTQAIHSLKRFGLFRDRDDEVVEPTGAALRAGALLMGPICISVDS
jgi:hypothetical protein